MAGTLLTGGVTSLSAASAATCAPVSDAYSQAVRADSPSAYYRLDETSGPTLCDASAKANNGTYASSGVTYGVAGATIADKGVGVGQPSSGVGTGGSGSGLTGNHSFTYEGWYRSTGTVHDQTLVDMGQPGQGKVAGLSTWTSDVGAHVASQLALDVYVGVPAAGTNNTWDTSAVAVNLYDGKWHYIAVTYSAASDLVTGYVDGKSLGAHTPPAAINLAASAVRVGYWVDTAINQPLVGNADDVAVYPTALSAKRIAAHYQARRRPTVVSVSPASGPTTGGTAITVTGTGFVTGAKVEIAQGTASPVLATSVRVISPTKLTAVTGGNAATGTWNVFVLTSGGKSPVSSGDRFTYQ